MPLPLYYSLIFYSFNIQIINISFCLTSQLEKGKFVLFCITNDVYVHE